MTDEETPSLRILIADDEEPARLLMREMLTAHDEVTLVGEAANGLEAVKLAQALSPDILFVDVQMPKLDGFEVVELVPSNLAVVFTTAYDEYAVRAFEVNAVDYLLKPFSQERFDAALERAKGRVGTPRAVAATTLAASSRGEQVYLERIVVRDGAKVEIIPVTSLDFVQGQDDYVELHAGARSPLKQQTLQSLEASLDPRHFVRIHRSYLLNLDRLARLEPMERDRKVAVLKDGRKLPVSRAGEARLKQLLDPRR